jgi:hypothetical protein
LTSVFFVSGSALLRIPTAERCCEHCAWDRPEIGMLLRRSSSSGWRLRKPLVQLLGRQRRALSLCVGGGGACCNRTLAHSSEPH